MAQVINITAQWLNGSPLVETPHVGLPTLGIVITQLNPAILVNGNSCVSQIRVLATNDLYYSTTAVGTLISACNAPLA